MGSVLRQGGVVVGVVVTEGVDIGDPLETLPLFEMLQTDFERNLPIQKTG